MTSSIAQLASSECVADLLEAGHPVRARVQGRSMMPSLPDGSLVTIEPAASSSLQLGDITFYRSPGGRITCHRLLAKRCTGGKCLWGFRGDAFTSSLEWTTDQAVIGKVVDLDGRTLDTPLVRLAGLTGAWNRWLLAQLGIKLGALRRSLIPRRQDLPKR